MLRLLLIIVTAGMALATGGHVLHIEFTRTLNDDSANNVSFCNALTETLGGNVLCSSMVAEAQNDLFMADITVTVYNLTINLYAPGNNYSQALSRRLHDEGFFTLRQSDVTQITDFDRPVAACIAFSVVTCVVFSITALCFFSCTRPDPPPATEFPIRRRVAVVPKGGGP